MKPQNTGKKDISVNSQKFSNTKDTKINKSSAIFENKNNKTNILNNSNKTNLMKKEKNEASQNTNTLNLNNSHDSIKEELENEEANKENNLKNAHNNLHSQMKKEEKNFLNSKSYSKSYAPKNYRVSFQISETEKLEFCLLKDNLMTQEVNAIVNAANEQLQLGGGVAGQIRMIGGSSIQRMCDKIIDKRGVLKIGEVEATGKGDFKNENLKYIFHAVGPFYHGGKSQENYYLEKAFSNCLNLANELNLKSIAIPPISTGIFGFPIQDASEIFFFTVLNYWEKYLFINKKLEKNSNTKSLSLQEIRMTVYDEKTFLPFEATFLKTKHLFEEKFGKENIKIEEF